MNTVSPVSPVATHSTEALHDAAASPTYEASFAASQPAMAALTPAQLVAVNLDIAAACTTVAAALPALLALRPQLAQLPFFRIAELDALRVHQEAALFAHAQHTRAMEAPSPVPALAQDCSTRLGVLMHATQSLIDCAFLPVGTLGNYGQDHGHQPTALDLLALVTLLRTEWHRFEGHTTLTRAMLDEDERSVHALRDALSERERLGHTPDTSSEQRQRALSLMMRGYEEVRRGVLFLRWYDGDAEQLTPSLFAGRSGAHAKDPVVAPTPAAPNAAMRALSGDPASTPDLAAAMPKSPFVRS